MLEQIPEQNNVFLTFSSAIRLLDISAARANVPQEVIDIVSKIYLINKSQVRTIQHIAQLLNLDLDGFRESDLDYIVNLLTSGRYSRISTLVQAENEGQFNIGETYPIIWDLINSSHSLFCIWVSLSTKV